MSETNRRYQSSIEHDDKVIEHARLIDMGWSQAQADEKVWGPRNEPNRHGQRPTP